MIALPTEAVDRIQPLLERAVEDHRQVARLVEALVEVFRARLKSTYFPTSDLRECCRQFARQPFYDARTRLVFYLAAADAIIRLLEARVDSDRQAAAAIRDVLERLDDPGEANFKLRYIHGLPKADLERLFGLAEVESTSGAVEQAIPDEMRELLELPGLIEKGEFTQEAEPGRDDPSHRTRAWLKLVQRLEALDRALTREEAPSTSVEPGDALNEFFMRELPEPPLNSRKAIALARKHFRNYLIDRARRRLRRCEEELVPERGEPILAGGPEEDLLDEEARLLIQEAVSAVSRNYARPQMLERLLREYLTDPDASLEAVARKYEIPPSTARYYLRHAAEEFVERVRN